MSGSVPIVTIGVPVYNGTRYLGRALESITGQTYEAVDIVISDNCSSDDTEEICRTWAARDPRIRYERQPANLGAAPNFNHVFRMARGKYFKWAAHDDELYPEYVAKCVELLERDPSSCLCHSKAHIIDEHGEVIHGHRHERDFSPAELSDLSSEHSYRRHAVATDLAHPCLDVFGVARRDLLERTSLIGSYVGSDRVLLAELALHGKIVRVDEVGFRSREHPQRSVRSMPLNKRANWFDTSAEGDVTAPQWHLFREYLRGVRHATIPASQKARCYTGLVAWLGKNRRLLVHELVQTVGSPLRATVRT